MSLFEKFNRECGSSPFSFDIPSVRKVGLNYTFKFGKYKGMDLIDILIKDKEYIKYIFERGDITFTKKDEDKIRKILYGDEIQNYT